jgi:hypothetical protein
MSAAVGSRVVGHRIRHDSMSRSLRLMKAANNGTAVHEFIVPCSAKVVVSAASGSLLV